MEGRALALGGGPTPESRRAVLPPQDYEKKGGADLLASGLMMWGGRTVATP